MQLFNDGRDWFFKRRFGLFFHWGIYAVGRFHEQEIFRRHLSRETYAQNMGKFNPVMFDPDAWVDMALSCGMEYMVITAKHIDGFCLWDTQCTSFNIMNTPYGQDIIKLLADACYKKKMPFGVYYSCADMHQKNYPHNNRSYEFQYPQQGDQPDLSLYMAYVKQQVTELCSQYGPLAVFYWDANVLGHKDESVNAIIRKLQPSAMINDRGYDPGDFSTPEREFDQSSVNRMTRFVKPSEAIQAVSMLSWSCKTDDSYYSSKFLIRSMARVLCLGGNYNLNIGPNADGTLNEREVEMLRKIGLWVKTCREAIYDALPASELIDSDEMMMTISGNNLYIHLINDPKGDSIVLRPLTALPDKAILLNTGQILKISRDMGVRSWSDKMDSLTIGNIPVETLYDTIPVIKLVYDKIPDIYRQKLLAAVIKAEDPFSVNHTERNFTNMV